MAKQREALLVAILAGVIIVSAAAFVLQPVSGGKSDTAMRTSAITAPILGSRLG